MSKKHQKISKTLNYIECFFTLVSALIGCVSNFFLASLVSIPRKTTSSATGLKFWTITAAIKKYKLIINKEKKKHDKIVLLIIIKVK